MGSPHHEPAERVYLRNVRLARSCRLQCISTADALLTPIARVPFRADAALKRSRLTFVEKVSEAPGTLLTCLVSTMTAPPGRSGPD